MTANTATIPSGVPLANPIYLVDASGNPISSGNPLNIGLAVDTLDAQVTNDGTFAKETGGNLASMVTVEGATNDAAVVGDVNGSISAKLRGLNKIFNSVWDSVNSWLQVKVMNANSLGQQLTVASTSIVPASDSPNFPIKRNGVALYSLASTLENASGNSGDLNVAAYTEIGIDITTTAHAGTSPTVQFFWNRKGADGLYYPLWQSAVFSAAANTLSTSIGAGMAYAQSLGLNGQLSWVIGGSATPSVTFSANVYGK